MHVFFFKLRYYNKVILIKLRLYIKKALENQI